MVMKRSRLRTVLVLVLLVAGAMAFTGCTEPQQPSMRLLVIGDQWSAETQGPGWAALLVEELRAEGRSVQLTLDAVEDSAYISAEPNSVGERIDRASGPPPTDIVLALGATDVTLNTADEVRESAVSNAVAAAAATGANVVVLAPITPSGGVVESTLQWSEELANAAAGAGATFVSLSFPQDGLMLAPDGTLTADGQRYITSQIEPHLSGPDQ